MDELSKITVELSRQEALILYEYLRRCDDDGTNKFADQAEERVLWTLEGHLEKALHEIFDPNYGELLRQAWAEVRDEE
jgi:hypothetical protein